MEAGWTEEEIKKQIMLLKSDQDPIAMNKELLGMWREIEKNENAWPFREPVDLHEVPDYTKIVAHPIGEHSTVVYMEQRNFRVFFYVPNVRFMW